LARDLDLRAKPCPGARVGERDDHYDGRANPEKRNQQLAR
jgi:hypothetical protein